jgi:hypothetical protein
MAQHAKHRGAKDSVNVEPSVTLQVWFMRPAIGMYLFGSPLAVAVVVLRVMMSVGIR